MQTYLIILSILVFTFINGIVKIILNMANTLSVYGIIINMIWSLYYVPYKRLKASRRGWDDERLNFSLSKFP